MRSAVIVSTARTPLTRSWAGALNLTHGATLAAHTISSAIERAGVDPGLIDEPPELVTLKAYCTVCPTV